MTTPDRAKTAIPRRLALPCQCAGNCAILLVMEWGDDDPEYGLSIYEHVCCQRRRRDRLRVAWAVLRGREPWVHELILGDEQGSRLARFLAGDGDA